MASFAEAPQGDKAKGEKIFKTKCAQCHVPEKGGGHKQVRDVLLRTRIPGGWVCALRPGALPQIADGICQ